ncbi:4-phosphoerythronate dehydrogenase [Biformimicrobium ophioploci]|uniref:Erythronate-4-phosphate dehydrogenase n=1 Tax=Biformimicrobium ophioploci TaxID=3036711 RepID=A0ABQ6LY56_9GAMM|nr:4-phosphoerythronate dehydrogenase [Microbulbifer sp. NKW57]GMG87006.1 4-phosphoerythronate dehydrogenase PdxB [Microbulbifer sp. NKW57]
MLNIVADENIPGLETWFAPLGRVTRVNGRTVTPGQVRDADVLLVRSVTPVGADLLEGSAVRFVGTCTIGTDHVDIDWLQRAGIAFSAAPGCNARSVMEYVFCALAALDVPWWDKSFGIVGCGNVGGRLYRTLRALGLECVVYDPWLGPEDCADLAPLEQVLQQQVVCLHAPLVRGGLHPSLHMIGERELAMLGHGSVLLNAGRGGVVDNHALSDFISARPDIEVVLDVWEGEPSIDPGLLAKVSLGTPHIAGYSYDGKLAGTELIYHALADYLGQSASGPGNDIQDKTVIDCDLGSLKGLSGALLQIYDPRRDDEALRHVALGGDLGGGFDRLRREYPRRLEFNHFRLSGHGSVVPREVARVADVLGLEVGAAFAVKQERK